MVEGYGLENRRAGNGTVGSNPTPSASKNILLCQDILFLPGIIDLDDLRSNLGRELAFMACTVFTFLGVMPVSRSRQAASTNK